MQLLPAARTKLETRLAELLLSNLAPCDLGDGIEVVHDVEDDVEIEMDCDLEDDKPRATRSAAPLGDLEDDVAIEAAPLPAPPDCELASTTQFVRVYSAPYERIEIEGVDSSAFARTIAAGHVVRASHVERAAHVVGAAHPRTVMRNIETDTAPFSPYEPSDLAR
ncbi:MAG TPA: hypothetical protein VIV11_35475 [Kofleriaceae bacterium]